MVAQSTRPHLNITKAQEKEKKAGGIAQEVEQLPNTCKALSSIHSTDKQKRYNLDPNPRVGPQLYKIDTIINSVLIVKTFIAQRSPKKCLISKWQR
jgi:hypothetical protein